MAKVIFINRFFYPDHSATSQLLSDLVFHLAEKGLEVSVICSQQHYEKNGEALKARENINGVNVYRVKTSNFGRYWLPGRAIDYVSFFIGMIFTLLKVAKSSDVVVAKTDPPLTSILSVIASKLKHAVHINWVQDLFPEVLLGLGSNQKLKILGKGLIWARNKSFNSSQKTIVIGTVMRDKLVSEGIKPDSLVIIPNWSDGNAIKPVLRDDNPLRKQWNLSGKFVVGYSGNMGRVHEFDTILDAAAKLNDHKDILFLFIGGGAQKTTIATQGKNRALNNIMFQPYQDYAELSNSLSLPDVHLISLKPVIEGYCVPSKYFGILAAGRTSLFIGDESGEISQLVTRGGNGFQVSVGDSDRLVRLILQLKQDSQLLHQLSINARDFFECNYSKEKRFDEWEGVLKTYM